ncbi:hypothetical protein F4775DRAFT_567732 [Biscogniauxia sp. FL1348]|nr:hypothetical protein F4775DRAFT_567732 [Biscogniauxia sp. FL1348]
MVRLVSKSIYPFCLVSSFPLSRDGAVVMGESWGERKQAVGKGLMWESAEQLSCLARCTTTLPTTYLTYLA